MKHEAKTQVAMVLVPREPTESMIDAALSAVSKPGDFPTNPTGDNLNAAAFRTRYRAAILAATAEQTPAAVGGPEVIGYRVRFEQTPENECLLYSQPDSFFTSDPVVLLSEHRGHVAPLVAEIEQLKGLQPEGPPRPPQGSGLPRYGLRWNGPQQPLSVPMDDGYWTPWHLANQLQTRVSDLERALGGMLFAFDDGVGRDWSAPVLDYARKQCRAVEYVARSTPTPACDHQYIRAGISRHECPLCGQVRYGKEEPGR